MYNEYYDIDKLKSQSNFCPLPFIHINAGVAGIYRPCCNSEYKLRYDETLNDSELCIEKVSIQDAFFSPEMVSIRQSFKDNQKHEACDVCWRNEKTGVFSARIGYLGVPFHIESKPTLSYIDMKFDNKCNLSCKMCDPSSSDQIWETVDLFEKQNLELPNHLRYVNIDKKRQSWRNQKNRNYFIEDKKKYILEIINNINFNKFTNPFILKVTGGEPFISKAFLELLDDIPEDKKKFITLKITTNGTKFTKIIFDKLKNFNFVQITLSIDGTGKFYEYIRYPFTFSKLNERITLLIKEILVNKLDNFSITISSLVTSYNFTNLWAVSKYAEYLTKMLGKKIDITYDFNARPYEKNDANICVLPNSVIQEGVNNFIKYVNNDYITNMFINYSQNHKQVDIDRQIRFKKTLINFDKIRNQNYKKVMPQSFLNWIESLPL